MNRRLHPSLFLAAFGCCALSATATSVYAGDFASGARVQPVESWMSAAPAAPRAYLKTSGTDAVPQAPGLRARIAPKSEHESLEALASKISFIGGLLLTADNVMRSVDSVMSAASYRRPDGTYLRLNAEPMSRGFLVGLTVGRPLDF